MTIARESVAHEDTFTGTGGLRVFYRAWRPADAARAVVVIIPGFNSHSGYYEWAAGQLTAAGVAVYAVDLRGRGKSDGDRFYVDSFDEYLSDVDGVVNVARSHEPGLPVFLLGHSAGGVLACLYAVEHQARLAGLLCESFAFQTPAPDLRACGPERPESPISARPRSASEERGFLARCRDCPSHECGSADCQ
jgi:acylglycerol lipase